MCYDSLTDNYSLMDLSEFCTFFEIDKSVFCWYFIIVVYFFLLYKVGEGKKMKLFKKKLFLLLSIKMKFTE